MLQRTTRQSSLFYYSTTRSERTDFAPNSALLSHSIALSCFPFYLLVCELVNQEPTGSLLIPARYENYTRDAAPTSENMSDRGSPAASPEKELVDDGQEQEFEAEVAAADSDNDSDALSEVDENLIEDYDPEAANIEDRPVDIDEDVARTLKATKRRRTDGDTTKKPREGRRDKKRRDKDEDVVMEDDGADTGIKQRRSRRGGDGERRPKAKASTPEQENEDLSPEERRKRAIDRALDAAIKKPSGARRRRKDEIVGFLYRIASLRMKLTMGVGS